MTDAAFTDAAAPARLGVIALTDEQELIAGTAREFVDNEVVPRARDADRAQRFDDELARRLGAIGYLGAPVAERSGGRGLDHLTYGLIVEEVGRGDSAMRTVVSVQTSLVCGSTESAVECANLAIQVHSAGLEQERRL